MKAASKAFQACTTGTRSTTSRRASVSTCCCPVAGAQDLDRIYHQVKQDLTLIEQRGADKRELLIRQQGFEDAVLWNPGAEKCAALADMPAEGWRQMLCIEAAAIEHPITLAPGEGWAGMQSLTLL